MRCVNCGWDNKNPNATACEKCGHPINTGSPMPNNMANGVNTASQQGAPAPRPTVVNANSPENMAPRPTVVNANMPEDRAPRPTRVMSQNMDVNELKKTVVSSGNGKTCPQCGHPITGNATTCLNCGYELANPVMQQQAPQAETVKPAPQEEVVKPARKEEPIKPAPKAIGVPVNDTNTCDKCGAEVPGDFLFCPKCGERIRQKTVMVRRKSILAEPIEEPAPIVEEKPAKCTLTLIPEEDDTTEAFTNEYEGASIILNRDNTEKTNRTITSKEQAELSFVDGKWYIENHSELGTTYIQTNRKFEIQPGDVIVLGDRRFTFETETASGK